MEGRPNDLRVYIDTNVTHDHTYYGNGCGPDIGSTTPCSTRIVQTNDGENQKNGTYYHFQAATVGTGGTIASENANSPDTFCPLGWQLPYSGTGGDYYDQSKSWKYLYDFYIDKEDLHFYVYPHSYIRSGFFGWEAGYVTNQFLTGNFWSNTIKNDTNAFRINTSNTPSELYGTVTKLFGFTLRCTKFLASNHRRHGGRNEH